MALGALIGAYHEDDSGGLTALLPLAGRTLVEYQVRCAAAAGASPIVVLVERIPAKLNQAFARLGNEGINVIPVSDGSEAATRFEPGELVLLIGDGIAPPLDLLTDLDVDAEPLVLTVPDDEAHEDFERVDGASRWSGIALVDAHMLGATAAMLGDWDLASTLLRRSMQGGARLVPVSPTNEPLLARYSSDLTQFERSLVANSRGERPDLASRYVLPPVEDFATERLLETSIPAEWLLHAALALTLAAAFAFTRGWLWAGILLLVLSAPLDLIAKRLGMIRLRPLAETAVTGRLLWPAAGLALIALGWWQARNGGGWGAGLTAVVACAFGEAYRLERGYSQAPIPTFLFSRRNAILGAVLFAIAGAWTGYLIALLAYAAISFFFVQFLAHRLHSQLTTH